MKIKKIKLCNFGIHRDLEFDTESKPVIGLLGKNGSGKSTILDAVKYGLTGELEGKLEEAVTIGKKKGFVELTIDKNGEEIIIKREVGKTPKREFSRGGKKITAAKEIEAAVQELLSVDKSAMSNACFLKQGSLNELLFGTESSREKLFIKLVNLSFCDRYGSIIDKKIQGLQAGVEDLQSILDEVNTQRMESIANKELLEKDLSRTTDYSSVIDLIDELTKAQTQIDNIESEVKRMNSDLVQSKSELGSIYLGYNVTSRTELEQKLKGLRDEYTDLVSGKSALIEKKNLKIRYDSTLREITDTKSVIETKTSNLADIEKKITDLKVPDVAIESLTEELALINHEVQKKGEWLSMQHTQCEAVNNICVHCGLELKHAPTQKELEEIRKDFESQINKKFELDSQLEADQQKFQSYEYTKTELTNEKNTIIGEIKSLEDQFSKLTNAMQEVYAGASVDDPSEEISNLSKKTEGLQLAIKRCENSLSKVISLDSKLDTSESILLAKKKTIDLEYTKIKTLEGNIEKELTALDLATFIGIAHEKVKLEAIERNRERTEAKGRLKEANEQFQTLNKRYVELQARVEENKSRLKVVDELKEVKEILSRKGLPRAVVEHKFDKLVNLTANNLSILNSDFSVSKDPDTFLSFIFERFDGHEHVQLPMNRLSGGQKVRLCIAFLLAVQQELVPEVGFQTFDEPSTHLDEEGVERLCSMFKGLQDLLRCIDHQVWICDHNPLLEESFNSTLRL